MYQLALQIAYKAHKGQTRKESCVPYIVHPIRVSNCFTDDFRRTVAVLHDVVEDTSVTFRQLKKCFPYKVLYLIDLLTRRDNETHFEYIERLSVDEVAIEIKIADIIDNLSDCLSVQPSGMIKRYNKSLDILINKQRFACI